MMISCAAEGASSKTRKKSSKHKKAAATKTVKRKMVKPVPEEPMPNETSPPATTSVLENTESASSEPELPKPRPRWSFSPRGLFWQEDITSTESGQDTFFHAQVFGISLGATRTFTLSSRRWIPFAGADFAFGTIKAQGESTGHIDSFKNQPWYWLGATLGTAYRHATNSEIRFTLPLGVRTIQWKSARQSLEMGQGSMFCAGLGVTSATKIGSKNSFLVAGFTHMYQWHSTLWSAGFEWLF